MKYIAAILMVIVLLEELNKIRSLIIPTKKSILEICIISCFEIVILIITYIYAYKWNDYVIAILGFILLFVSWSKQGISKEGILLCAKGKQLYKWDEIGEAKVKIKNDIIEVYYFNTVGVEIIKHTFNKKNMDSVISIFKFNKISFS